MKTIKDLDIDGKKVIIRCDFRVSYCFKFLGE